MITGASDGIGKAYALELAKQGFNIALLVRNYNVSKALAEQLDKLNPGIQVKIILVDFSKSCSNEYMFNDIYEQLKDLDIGILVNNVGLYTSWAS